jgi:hypothetical protein
MEEGLAEQQSAYMVEELDEMKAEVAARAGGAGARLVQKIRRGCEDLGARGAG